MVCIVVGWGGSVTQSAFLLSNCPLKTCHVARTEARKSGQRHTHASVQSYSISDNGVNKYTCLTTEAVLTNGVASWNLVSLIKHLVVVHTSVTAADSHVFLCVSRF